MDDIKTAIRKLEKKLSKIQKIEAEFDSTMDETLFIDDLEVTKAQLKMFEEGINGVEIFIRHFDWRK